MHFFHEQPKNKTRLQRLNPRANFQAENLNRRRVSGLHLSLRRRRELRLLACALRSFRGAVTVLRIRKAIGARVAKKRTRGMLLMAMDK